MAKKKLQVKNLQVSFRTQGGILKAVRDISFDLMEGETLAIVGESGSGKSVTSKAIIGILSGNSIVEGGEILYDGKDLLKIPEEDMHKIRGDKIAMIFQDPLSALNPIMRVGKQLTEAMILNGKARQRNAKSEFNSHLKLLRESIASLPGEDAQKATMCDIFDRFVRNATKLEKEYDDAKNDVITLISNIDEFAFLLEKEQKVDYKRYVSDIASLTKKSLHPYVIGNAEEANALINALQEAAKAKDVATLKEKVEALDKMAKDGRDHGAPDFFRLGFYCVDHPEFNPLGITDIPAFDQESLAYLDEHFMKDFLVVAVKGFTKNREECLEKVRKLMPDLRAYREYLGTDAGFADKGYVYSTARKLNAAIRASIDGLRTVRASSESSFGTSILHEIDRYYFGVRANPKNISRYERQKAKWDALSAKGKTPSWQVVPPYTVDLELTKGNIIKILDNLIVHYEKQVNKKNFDNLKHTIGLVDFLKDQASRLAAKVTQGVAKARALELLKEVGIPQPHIRYKQYPFEFSGGMRQRIVIAIALSANPDILICDEPTTALDVTIQAQILELINRIKVERNLSVIFITHDLGVVANMADRIAVMYAGKIVELGDSDDIFYDPRHPYTWALLSSMPDLDTSEKLEAIPGTPPNMIYPPVGDAFAERNKYALAIDFEKQPPMFQISETHSAATWLLHPQAPKVNPPKIITDRIARMKKEAKEYHE